jgi:Tfp pilus assembly protein PilF
MIAGAQDRISLSLLATDGRGVVEHQQAEPPPGFSPSTKHKLGVRGSLPSLDLAKGQLDDPNTALFQRLLGGWLSMSAWLGDLEQARAFLRPALLAAPSSAIVKNLDAQLMMREGYPLSLAQASLRKSLDLDPTCASALMILARSLERDSRDQALTLLDRAEAAAPSSPDPPRTRFAILKKRGWLSEAEANLKRALDRGPTSDLLDEAARFYRQQLQVEQAQELEARAAKLAEPNGLYHKNSAAMLKGDAEGAAKALEDSAQFAAQPAESLGRAGETLLEVGQTDRAIPLFERALALDPLSPRALRGLAIAKAAHGDAAKERALLERLRRIGADDLDLELALARLDERSVGQPPLTSWLGAKLAVDPLALAREKTDPRWSTSKRARLLERVVDHVRSDGHALSLRHQVTRLLTKEATDLEGEFRLPGESLPLALRTIKADGRIFEVDRHAGKADLSFSALAPGDTTEQEWLTMDEPATLSGGYFRQFYFQDDTPHLRAELAVVVPKGTPVWYHGYHGAPEPEIHDDGGETVYYWHASDVPGLVLEPSMVPYDEFLPFVIVAVGLDEGMVDLANRAPYEGVSRTSFDIRALAKTLTAGMKGDAEKCRRIFEWVSNNVRHGGFADPSVVLATRRGNRTGLLLALLRAADLDADLALARPGSAPKITPPFPDTHRYFAALVRVATKEGPLWIRADSASTWLGKATPEFRGGSYVLLSKQDPPASFAEDEVERWGFESKIELTLNARGSAKGTARVDLPGQWGDGLRQALRPLRKEDLMRAIQGWLSAVIPGAELEAVRFEGMDKELVPLGMVVELAVPSMLAEESGALVSNRFFTEPIASRAMNIPPLETYLEVDERRTPLFLPEAHETMTVTLKLPPGPAQVIEGPESFEKTTPFGHYVQRFSVNADTHTATLLRIDDTPMSRIPPSAFGGFRDAIQELALRRRNRLILGNGPKKMRAEAR